MEKVRSLSMRNVSSGKNKSTSSNHLGFGLLLGAIGMIAFSFTLPATKIAVSSIDGLIVGFGRSVVALPLAILALILNKGGLPDRAALPRLGIVAVGNVFGFPVFSALALFYSPAAHAAVIFGLMPLTVACAAVVIGKERPSSTFWLFSCCGALVIGAFSLMKAGTSALRIGDAYALVAVILGSIGYAESGVLAKRFGPMRVQAWALLLSAPVVLPIVGFLVFVNGLNYSGMAWAGLIYVGAVSSFLGFIPWNLGMVYGGVARVGQILLLQPMLTIVWSALLLNEKISTHILVTVLLLMFCVFFAVRARIKSV